MRNDDELNFVNCCDILHQENSRNLGDPDLGELH